ncbi:MAG TPA: Rieske 2Fe-2S domain-containing protein [Solirubrobacteraceae bacterium]|nr:Rieske 2Fe-2S domain-containing protein [Solirubrobacteraceae bacterium]
MTDGSEGNGPAARVGRGLGVLLALRTAWRAARREEPVGGPPPGSPPGSGGADGNGSDRDPSERTVPANPRAELLVAGLLMLAAVAGVGFILVYAIVQTNTQLLGLALGLGLLFLAAAAIVAGKFVVPQETSVEPRDVLLKEEPAEEVVEIIEAGGEGISRRGLLTVTGGLAGACVLGAAAAPIASMGPPAHLLHQTPWRRGIRFVNEDGTVYAASDISIGSFYTALPEGGNPDSLGAGILVIRLPSVWINLPPARHDWAPQGIMAFSKICPHAGCAINLYRYPLDSQTVNAPPAFTCPCHYSTFTPGDGGKLIFGPAGRELPQMPVMIDSDGNLRCAGPFDSDIGPSWWGVRRV